MISGGSGTPTTAEIRKALLSAREAVAWPLKTGGEIAPDSANCIARNRGERELHNADRAASSRY